ncbi:amylo-alpha-1,6-glucosidase [Microbacterium sp. cx-55]|uniref:glycogen debranching N-terminal domain-containing protein n=1 Tax=Microbacterium sp. cx-55 TaxID=2875948 RepID=UPI001CC0F14F|nr:glycogen debranching N-terminal domain-containing protein [Microbacterium sp. cx-55]MBZ4486079.1 amylo-alpha-1,6-glucosidase [Microbacterium sp. cx-55]UGB34050.1 amylo-alpha-1,6-glucosidase [Microbacterium sp. cx-55]
MTVETTAAVSAQQPFLHDALIALRAPTQVWSARTGDLGTAPIHGVYHGDVRHVRLLECACEGSEIEWISAAEEGASDLLFVGLLRGLDGGQPDPRVRLERSRRVGPGALTETWMLRNGRDVDVTTELRLRLVPDFASMHDVKAGQPGGGDVDVRVEGETAVIVSGPQRSVLRAPEAEIAVDADGIHARWTVTAPARSARTVTFALALHDDEIVVAAPTGPSAGGHDEAIAEGRALEPRLGAWLRRALSDLDALRLVIPGHPADEFYAAGAPWFFTLFGRDSLWSARLALPRDVGIAASTLRVLARLQGSIDDVDTAQEPGKILHELRATALEIPGEGVVLPPLYYGSVDSTPLWICLLADAWRAGMPEQEVRDLLPALHRALEWMLVSGDSDGDGFLDYIDRSGRGLTNQGWKDSGDSIQWRDGRLAEGPIALCEVQGYAYEAAVAAADILEALDDHDGGHVPGDLREWAAALRDRFRRAYWVSTPEGRYPAVALDRDKRPVDTLTSNVGHLIGTGILDPDEEAHVARLLLGATMSSGFGIRTLSTDAAGYWPLSYHGGSVWTHDTAIAAHGMLRAGLVEAAGSVVGALLDAAEGFDYRVPELHAGDPKAQTGAPVPYPAACRPQAWSAAASVTALAVLRAEALRLRA